MKFLNALTDSLRKRFLANTRQTQSPTRLRLEHLEDRLTPSPVSVSTYTNASVQISPSLAGFSATETITATVTPFSSLSISPSGAFSITAPPPGATNPTNGNVLFNLNNLQMSAPLNSNGQATVTIPIPLLSLFTSQALTVAYQGTPPSSVTPTTQFTYGPSTFHAPLYTNFDNVIFSSTLTFKQLTPQQVYAATLSTTFTPPFTLSPPTVLPPYFTAQGETDQAGFFTYNYVDPGTINTVGVFGIQLPGIFAFVTGAYGGLSSPS